MVSDFYFIEDGSIVAQIVLDRVGDGPAEDLSRSEFPFSLS
jgi:hypothetical protein